MEDSMDEMNTTLPELKNFILPGGHPANSQAHIARCVCRRAERRTAELQTHTEMDAHILPYLNRLSDWLFVLSRTISLANGAEEILWKPGEPTS
jgi:cob(I)alamin adenosyltransferase